MSLFRVLEGNNMKAGVLKRLFDLRPGKDTEDTDTVGILYQVLHGRVIRVPVRAQSRVSDVRDSMVEC